jgi:hypothetical protein
MSSVCGCVTDVACGAATGNSFCLSVREATAAVLPGICGLDERIGTLRSPIHTATPPTTNKPSRTLNELVAISTFHFLSDGSYEHPHHVCRDTRHHWFFRTNRPVAEVGFVGSGPLI